MASKSLPRWNASTSFRFQIDEEFRDSVLDGLSRKELCLDLLVSADNDDEIEYGCSLYPAAPGASSGKKLANTLSEAIIDHYWVTYE